MDINFYKEDEFMDEQEVIGYIDWDGVFHKCKYGQHSELAFYLAKKLLNDDSYSSEKKIEYGLIKISRHYYLKDSNIYYCYLPKVINENQINTLNEIIERNDVPKLTMAIKYALEDRLEYPEVIEEKIDVMSVENVHPMTDCCDYGNTGFSL